MTPNSPQVLKAGLVVLEPGTARVVRVISLQYNPDSLSRTLQMRGSGADAEGQRAQPLRLSGPATETLKLEAEIDATDQLEFPKQNRAAVEHGIAPELAVLESLVNPTMRDLRRLSSQLESGVLEIVPPEAPLTVFVWGKNRVVPVRVTEFSITEEAFDPALNPIRAKVSLGFQVLTTDDLGFQGRGGNLFLAYLQGREGLAGRARAPGLAELGIRLGDLTR